MRTVKEILSSKGPMTNVIEPTKLVIEGLQLLNAVNLSYLVVMEGDEYKGVFSERDYARNVVLKGHSSKDTMIREVMTVDLPVVSLTDTLEHCMNRMNTHRTRYILAYDNKKFAGVLTIHDLLRQVLANKEDAFDHTITRNLIDSDERGRIF
ncbi:MAG: CBS domain-containing protein [Chitinophagaceae bacterium]|nr:MAG: CBS domain-containing protein [Chitinophagaceae bacterium]